MDDQFVDLDSYTQACLDTLNGLFVRNVHTQTIMRIELTGVDKLRELLGGGNDRVGLTISGGAVELAWAGVVPPVTDVHGVLRILGACASCSTERLAEMTAEADRLRERLRQMERTGRHAAEDTLKSITEALHSAGIKGDDPTVMVSMLLDRWRAAVSAGEGLQREAATERAARLLAESEQQAPNIEGAVKGRIVADQQAADARLISTLREQVKGLERHVGELEEMHYEASGKLTVAEVALTRIRDLGSIEAGAEAVGIAAEAVSFISGTVD